TRAGGCATARAGSWARHPSTRRHTSCTAGPTWTASSADQPWLAARARDEGILQGGDIGDAEVDTQRGELLALQLHGDLIEERLARGQDRARHRAVGEVDAEQRHVAGRGRRDR